MQDWTRVERAREGDRDYDDNALILDEMMESLEFTSPGRGRGCG